MNPNQLDKVTRAFSGLVQAEIDAICPEESMSRWMDRIGVIEGSEVDADGNMLLFIEKENGRHFQLVLKPVRWEKRTPVKSS